MHLLIICLYFSSQTKNKGLSLFKAKRKKSFTLGQQPHSNSCCNCILLILIIHGQDTLQKNTTGTKPSFYSMLDIEH